MVAVPLLLGLGCTSEAEEPLPRAAALELGELDQGREFSPYEPEQRVLIHQGLQGGFHVYVDGRLVGDEIDEQCLIDLRMVRLDDDLEITTIQHLREPDLLPDSRGNRTFDDMIVFIPDPALVDGQRVRIEAEIEVGDQPLEGDEVLLELELAEG